MQKQPLLILLLSFMIGILVQEFFCLPLSGVAVVLILSVISSFIFFSKSLSLLRFKNIFYIFIAFSLGIFLHFYQNQIPKFPTFNKEDTVIFKLQKKLKSNEKNKKYEVTVWKNQGNKIEKSLQFTSILILPRSEPDLNFNNFYQATGYISRIEPTQNDFQFDYQKYLQRKAIYHQIFLAKGFKQSSRNSLSIIERLKQNRLDLLQKIDESSISVNSKELIKGIILADRTEMNSETVADFQKTGLVHILAISGTHIAIIFGLFYFIFIKIFPSQWRKYAIFSSIIFIWFFAVFIGLGNSVVRACIMLTVYFSYTVLQRKSDFLHSISMAAIIILIFNVNQIFDVGFQLSFLAVLGIFWFNAPILAWFPAKQNRFATLFKNIFSVTTSAQLGTMPLVLFYFHQYSWISVIANLIVLPAVEILIVGALLVTFFIATGLQISVIFKLYDFAVDIVLKTIHWLSSFDFFMIKNIGISLVEVVLLFLLLYFLRFLMQKFNVKNILNVGYILIFFIAVRAGFYFYFQQKNEIISHQFYKQNVVSVKNHNKISFYINEKVDESTISAFIISPYLTSRRMEKFEIVKVPASVDTIILNGKKYQIK